MQIVTLSKTQRLNFQHFLLPHQHTIVLVVHKSHAHLQDSRGQYLCINIVLDILHLAISSTQSTNATNIVQRVNLFIPTTKKSPHSGQSQSKTYVTYFHTHTLRSRMPNLACLRPFLPLSHNPATCLPLNPRNPLRLPLGGSHRLLSLCRASFFVITSLDAAPKLGPNVSDTPCLRLPTNYFLRLLLFLPYGCRYVVHLSPTSRQIMCK